MGATMSKELDELKDRLLGAWRSQYHAEMSGTPKQIQEARDWSARVETEATKALEQHIAQEKIKELEKLRIDSEITLRPIKDDERSCTA